MKPHPYPPTKPCAIFPNFRDHITKPSHRQDCCAAILIASDKPPCDIVPGESSFFADRRDFLCEQFVWGARPPVALYFAPRYDVQLQSPYQAIEFVYFPAFGMHPEAVPVLEGDSNQPIAFPSWEVAVSPIFKEIQCFLYVL
jgi:hypothetical protein